MVVVSRTEDVEKIVAPPWSPGAQRGRQWFMLGVRFMLRPVRRRDLLMGVWQMIGPHPSGKQAVQKPPTSPMPWEEEAARTPYCFWRSL